MIDRRCKTEGVYISAFYKILNMMAHYKTSTVGIKCCSALFVYFGHQEIF